ncbi:MAG: non-homologous end-joining DNA ligase [Cellulomonadaceae bacterium]|jgi:bifunctional non-homologous end joining protein LigD|nr:non-homologous end-joining DNA ligase [Cellulomonadaceae bacterium]
MLQPAFSFTVSTSVVVTLPLRHRPVLSCRNHMRAGQGYAILSVMEPSVALTNPEKVLYPAAGTTKSDIFNYYREIAPYLVPHLVRRPVTRRVWPNGVAGTTFFAKDAARGVPDWIQKVPVSHKSGPKDYVVLDSQAALEWDAQQAGLEIHVPQWRFAGISDDNDAQGKIGEKRVKLPPEALNPDRLVIDLDPGEGATLADCAQVALRAREVLKDIGLEAFPVTSGSKGIHLYASLVGFKENGKPITADKASVIAKEIAKLLEAEQPDKVISTMSKASRAGKVLVDWSQNNGKKTTISPYSLRGQETPYVAAPRTWAEIEAPGLKQLTYKQVLARVAKDGDLLAGLLHGSQPGSRHDAPLGAVEGKPKKEAKSAPNHNLAESKPKSGAPAKATRRSPTKNQAESQNPGYSPMLASMPNQSELAMLERAGKQDDPDWGFEIKWDGYRAIAVIIKQNGKPTLSLWSRNGQNYTETYPEISSLAEQVKGPFPVVLDGEIVAFDSKGRPSFSLLQQHGQKKANITFQCFDILKQGEKGLTKLPFTERRDILDEVLQPQPPIYISPLIPYQDAMSLSTAFRLEGVMAKRLNAPYQAGIRSKDWLKIKHLQTGEFVVVGYTPLHAGEPNETKEAIGSLLLARHDLQNLCCVGRVGTGFTTAQRREIQAKLESIAIKAQPLNLTGVTQTEAKHINWVEPVRSGLIEYAEWTTDPVDPAARLRHPRWRGWA